MQIISCRDCGLFKPHAGRGRRCRECYNIFQRERARYRRATDPVHRQETNRKAREAYQRDAERINAASRKRYAEDPRYRAKFVKAGREYSMRRSVEREQRRPSNPNARVYFVQESTPDGFIKIGFTATKMTGHRGRLTMLQNGNPRRLVILATMPGSKLFELQLHHRFDSARVMNEWFRPVPELLEFIEEQRSKQTIAS